MSLVNLVRVVSATTGTGPLTLGLKVQGFLNMTEADAVDGEIYSYAIEADYVASVATSREQGTGVWDSGGNTLTRNVINSTNSDALLNLTGDEHVIIAPHSGDFGGGGREIVTSARTYYVNNSTGNDADDGLTTGNAFATIGKAINVVCDDTYWLNVQPTISVAKTGIDYDEHVLLRAWQGTSSDYYNTAIIIGDATDPTHGTGVLIKPTADISVNAVVEAKGSRWQINYISVDGSGNAVNPRGCYAANDEGHLIILVGDLGPTSDLGFACGQLVANNHSSIVWQWDAVHNCHIYGVQPLPLGSTFPIFIQAAYDSSIIVNVPIIFDDNPDYWVVSHISQDSSGSYYHQCTFAGDPVTGQRWFLDDHSRFHTRLQVSQLPGDSFISGIGGAQSEDSIYNWPTFNPTRVFADLPTTPLEGTVISITDSNTNTAGDVAAGGGAFRVPLWYDGTDWLVLAPIAAAAGGGLTVGTTAIASGTSPRVLYEAAGNVLGESSAFTIVSNQPNVTSGNAYLYNGVNVLRAVTADSNWWFAGAGNLTATGTLNIGIGASFFGLIPLGSLTNGSNNVAIGDGAFAGNTSGSNNVGLGILAGRTNDTGSNNVAIGAQSLSGAIGGTHTYASCIAIGAAAMGGATGGSSCIAIGATALNVNGTGTGNVAVGGSALVANTDGFDNFALGFGALAGNTTGDSNIAIGASSLPGSNADNNTTIGAGAGAAVTSGSTNTIIGYAEGTISSGSRNISIGAQCGVPTATASNQLVIGNYIYGTGLGSTGSTISSGKIGLGVKAPACELDVDGCVRAQGYTIASTLPAAGVAGRRAYVTDSAASPVFGATVSGGGSVVVPVFDNGTNWIYG